VAIIGAGGVGLSAVTAAFLAGAAQIIAVDIHDATLQKALYSQMYLDDDSSWTRWCPHQILN
jgi:threonine dehydrogenase-like Zn-dependent dehydrogenase